MNLPIKCCRELTRLRRTSSPFHRIIALDWYDGPRAGLLQCGGCGREFHFEPLAEMINDEEGRDVRVFSLAPLTPGSLARFIEALSPYQTPRWPVWAPLWKFPTDADRAMMDRLTDQILGEAGPPESVVASSDLAGEILAAKEITPDELASVRDWFSLLGLAKVPSGT